MYATRVEENTKEGRKHKYISSNTLFFKHNTYHHWIGVIPKDLQWTIEFFVVTFHFQIRLMASLLKTPRSLIVLNEFSKLFPQDIYNVLMVALLVLHHGSKMGALRHHICQTFYTSTFSRFKKFTPRKRVNRDILNLEYYIFGIFIHTIGIISQFSYVYAHFTHYQWVKHGLILPKNWIMLVQLDLKHIHKVNFYPSYNNFTQALLVMLVTNIISDWWGW